MNKQRDKGQGTRDKGQADQSRAEQGQGQDRTGQDRIGQSGKTAKAWTAWTRAQKIPAGINLRGNVYNLNDIIRYSITTAQAAIRETRTNASLMRARVPPVARFPYFP